MRKILCVGTLIADIINEKIDRLPEEGECVTADVTLNLGGNAFSSSVNMKRLSSTNTNVYCYGLTGADAIGSLFEDRLFIEGVICCISKISHKKTSCNIILQQTGKDRRYIFNEGANSAASEEDILKVIKEVLPDVIVFGEIPSLGISGIKFLELIHYIRRHLCSIICLDTLINAQEDYGWLRGNWDKIDIVHCNFGEGLHITKQSTIPEVCDWFLKNGVKIPIVSDGENGCCFGYNGLVDHIPSLKTKEIDATGAGDAMMAGVITRFLELSKVNAIDTGINREIIKEIINYGSACGAVAVQSVGCISDICKEKVMQMIKDAEKTFTI